MNRFEQAVQDCMVPTAALLEQTTNPLHRAIPPNFWRHVHLEGAGDLERIVAADLIAVADWGVSDELTFHQLAAGSDLVAIGYDVPADGRLWHVSSRQSFIWPYDERARLPGENLYEDKTSLAIETVDPSEAITSDRIREIHRSELAKLEAERGERFSVLHQS